MAGPLAACRLVYRKGADAFLVRQSEAAGLGEFIPGASLCFEGQGLPLIGWFLEVISPEKADGGHAQDMGYYCIHVQ